MHDRDIDDLTRSALAAIEVIEPPPDFADRVVAEATRRDRPAITAPNSAPDAVPPRWRRWVIGVAAAAAVAVSAAAAVSWLSRQDGLGEVRVHPDLTEGTDSRSNIPLSDRGHQGGDRGTIPADLDQRVDAYVGDYGRLYGDVFRFHGVIVVLHKGALIFARGYGDAVRGDRSARGVRAQSPEMRTPIGTFTQQITAAAIMKLVERGDLGLDDPIRRHLPSYPEVGDRITIRMLLAHSSGIPSFTDDAYYPQWKGERSDSAGLLARFQDLPLEFEPGTDFDPSNSGYAVLGAILEAVSGQTYAEFVGREIFAPLGMTQSTVGEPPPGVTSAEGYLFNEEEELTPVVRGKLDLLSTGAAASIVASPLDLARFADGVLRGDLLGAGARDMMLTPSSADGYALGWITGHDRGQAIVGHPGGADGINAAIRYYREDQTLILALANNDVIDCRAVLDDLGALVHGGRPKAPREYQEIAVESARLPVYAGHYRLSAESRERLDAIYDLAEVDRMADADVIVTGESLTFYVPGHGSKWMHGYGVDSFFFKDAAGTVATFTVPAGASEASKLTLYQGRLEIVLDRDPSDPAPAPAE